ncbi:hypothetical protein LCGC14_1105510 [marine sediment metagenome]|uniref:Uncharacterized protein n=1 Tax=marine sediment metagenome TaxID=412755 RepID=A0A0F9MW79_9ZZZZ
MQSSDRNARDNKPITMFTIDGKKYDTKSLPILEIDDWLELVDDVQLAEKAMGAQKDPVEIRKHRREFHRQLFECVCAYNPEVFGTPEELSEAGVTASQMVAAFMEMQSISDPTVLCKTAILKEMTKRMKEMPAVVMEKIAAASG